ncbi:hypothetical protein SH1V18_42500 [Vallitalea longa]|uniref:SLH domain-containing protein n=1 Tax=Vallitalea longa TaxID=2936439 RepID=A0A9W6DGL7_9FIRM|nr:S-layer homology domain-containing protein [Vallitalea longa]GKX31770.1 hypothetical protein SH1V18_42500 [Vallitalea longa]
MKCTSSMKKMLTLVLALVLVITPINVKASEQSEADEFVTKFVSAVTGMSEAGREGIVNSVKTLLKADQKDDMKTLLKDMFSKLEDGQRERIETNLEISDSMEVVNALTDYVLGQSESGDLDTDIHNLEVQLGLEEDENVASLTEALKSRKFGEELAKIEGLTPTKVKDSIDKLDTIYKNLYGASEFGTDIVNLNTKTNYMSINNSGLNRYFDYMKKVEIIENQDSIRAAFQLVIDEYNDNNNRVAIKYILNEYNLINTYSSGDSGNSGSNGGGSHPSSGDDSSSTPASDQKLDELASKLGSGKLSGEEAASKVEEIVDELAESLADIKDQEGAFTALKSVSAVLGSTEKVIGKLKDADSKKEVVKQIEKTLDSTLVVLDMIDNASTVNLKAKAIIEDVAGIKDVLKDDVASVKKLDKVAVNLAEVAVSKAGATRIATSKVNFAGGKATADLSEYSYKAQIEKAVEAEKQMTKFLADNKIDAAKDFDVKMVLEVPTTKNTKEVNVTLPDLTDAFVSVDKVKVESGVASFELSAETFGKKEAAQVKLSATNVDVSALTSAQQQSVPSGVETLIDLNAYTDGNKVSEFNKAVEVAVPYELKDGEDAEKVSVYLLTDEGKVEKAAGKYDPLTGRISVMRKHFSKYFVAASTDKFTDLADYSWAEKPIEVLAGKGIINGMSEGIYGPSSKLTRAQFVALITRMYQLEASQDSPFEDVAADAWYVQDVAAAYQNGIINGVSETEFAPNNTITKQEAAKVIMNVLEYLGYKEEANNDLVKDVYADFNNIDSWAQGAVSTTVREEIFTAQNGDNFNPKQETTRAEAAVMIYNLFLVD